MLILSILAPYFPNFFMVYYRLFGVYHVEGSCYLNLILYVVKTAQNAVTEFLYWDHLTTIFLFHFTIEY